VIITGGAAAFCGPPVAVIVQDPVVVLAWYVVVKVPPGAVVPAVELIVPQVPLLVIPTASPEPAGPPPGTVIVTVKLDVARPLSGSEVGEALSATTNGMAVWVIVPWPEFAPLASWAVMVNEPTDVDDV
jgi:hypothetical protein